MNALKQYVRCSGRWPWSTPRARWRNAAGSLLRNLPALFGTRVGVACPPSHAGPAPAVRQHRGPEHALLPLQANQSAGVVLLVCATRPTLDAGALRHYIAKPCKEEGKSTESQMQAEQSCARWWATSPVGRTPRAARRAAPGTGRSGIAADLQEHSDWQSPLDKGDGGWQEPAARAKRSGAGAFLFSP